MTLKKVLSDKEILIEKITNETVIRVNEIRIEPDYSVLGKVLEVVKEVEYSEYVCCVGSSKPNGNKRIEVWTMYYNVSINDLLKGFNPINYKCGFITPLERDGILKEFCSPECELKGTINLY